MQQRADVIGGTEPDSLKKTITGHSNSVLYFMGGTEETIYILPSGETDGIFFFSGQSTEKRGEKPLLFLIMSKFYPHRMTIFYP